MRTICLVTLVVLCAGCTTYSKKKTAINAFGGVRSLENDDYNDIDDATVLGVEGLLGLNYTGLGLEGGYAHAEQDGGPLFSGTGGTDIETDELYLGLRQTWNVDGQVQPYIGVGAAWLDANAENSSGFNDDDNSTAGYGRAGIGIQLEHFQIGLDARALVGTDLEFDSEDTDLDYLQILGFIGWSF